MSKSLGIRSLAAIVFLLLLLMPVLGPATGAGQDPNAAARRQALKKEAALNLWRLKRAIEKDSFYNARVALNVWRSTAMEAGTFDPGLYESLKRKLYEKSVNASLECFEQFLQAQDYSDANICLQTWKMHSREIGTFDPVRYKALQDSLDHARTQ